MKLYLWISLKVFDFVVLNIIKSITLLGLGTLLPFFFSFTFSNLITSKYFPNDFVKRQDHIYNAFIISRTYKEILWNIFFFCEDIFPVWNYFIDSLHWRKLKNSQDLICLIQRIWYFYFRNLSSRDLLTKNIYLFLVFLF